MEEVYAATTFNTRQLFKYFSAFVVIPKHSEKICQPSDTSAKETCSGRVKSEAGSGTWKFASLGRWCNGGIHQQKTIGPWCRAEICKNQAVHYVNRLCSIIILYTVYVYIYTANTSRSGTREVYWRHHPSRILMSDFGEPRKPKASRAFQSLSSEHPQAPTASTMIKHNKHIETVSQFLIV